MGMRNRTGFTLIELLVVISIIAMLSSIILSSVNTARMKARDTRRIEDLKQIQNALELYRNDNNGMYPQAIASSFDNNSWVNLGNYLVPKYISKLPIDPINDALINKGYTYYYYSGSTGCLLGKCYDLVARLEDPNNPYRCKIKQYIRLANNTSWCKFLPTTYNMIYSAGSFQ